MINIAAIETRFIGIPLSDDLGTKAIGGWIALWPLLNLVTAPHLCVIGERAGRGDGSIECIEGCIGSSAVRMVQWLVDIPGDRDTIRARRHNLAVVGVLQHRAPTQSHRLSDIWIGTDLPIQSFA